MKNTILWLQLPQRVKADKHCLYSSISDISQWIERTSKNRMGEQARLYYSLIVEVNSIDIPVQERLIFLQSLHPHIINLVTQLSKKYSGCGLPLDEEKVKYVELVDAFWAEMTIGYKIVIDDLSDAGFISSLFTHKELVSAINNVLFYLTHRAFYNYKLYTQCSDNVWRDIHQVYHFAVKRKILNKTTTLTDTSGLSIEDQYKKVVLFSLANPYQLSVHEMEQLWHELDDLVKYTKIILDSKKVIEKKLPFIIKHYSDLAPFANQLNNDTHENKNQLVDELFSDAIWGLNTSALINYLEKHSSSLDLTPYLINRMIRVWSGSNFRNDKRNELIEPVSFAMGCSNVSQFLSQLQLEPRLLKLDEQNKNDLESTITLQSVYQAFLMDESNSGFRLKLVLEPEQSVFPNIGEIIAIKHFDHSIHIGYLRWLKENDDGDIEFGIEHLSSMAEPVQIILKNYSVQISDAFEHSNDEAVDKNKVLDSFVYPGSKANQYKPVLFTHAFIERFQNAHSQGIELKHSTGNIDIKLTQKIGEVLGYSLFLFEKADPECVSAQLSQSEKTGRFAAMWKKI